MAGQSSLRLLTTDKAQIRSTVNITYQGPLGQNGGDVGGSPDPLDGPQDSRINALFDASLFSPASVKTSPLDVWGNVKIPSTAEINCSSIDGAKDGTKDMNGTAKSSCQWTYSSLLGIPIAFVPTVGNTTFTVETSSFSVACHNVSRNTQVEEYGINDVDNTTFMKGQLESYWGLIPLRSTNDTPNYPFSLATNYLISDNDTVLEALGLSADALSDGTTYPMGQNTLLLQSRDLPTSVYASEAAPAYTRVYCNLSTSYVQSTVSCVAGDCAVTSAQPSLL